MDSVLDIIGNREAIAINQQWSGHPGRLVKEWHGTELNMSAADSGGYVWGVPCNSSDHTQRGWSYDKQQHAIQTPSGQCVAHNAPTAASILTTEECHGDNPNQKFDYGNTKLASNLSFTDGSGARYQLPPYEGFGLCLTLFGWEFPSCGTQPSARMFPCLGDQVAQHWTIHGSDSGTGDSSGSSDGSGAGSGVIADACGNCLAERRVPQDPGTSVQLWVKPQPQNAVAVLLINNSPQEQRPLVLLDAETLGKAAVGSSTATTAVLRQQNLEGDARRASFAVRDIWERAEMGVFSGTFNPTIPAYDSGFFLLKPIAV
eukprot:COSAG02_NODE_114_length_35585_cov_149.458293_13_plen_316_part_00